MESITHGSAVGYQQEPHNTPQSRVDLDLHRSFAPLTSRSTLERLSRRRTRTHFCLCLPISSGVWVISLLLTIPGIALVISFNTANFQGFIQFNSPTKIKVFYTVVYSLYALFGIVAGVTLRCMTVSQRLRSLIVLYWVLIASTILEGVYFGIMVSNQKSKLVYCDDYTGTATSTTTAPATAKYSDSGSGSVPRSEDICHKMHTLLGAFYIVGPGAWIILHIGWILVVVLYSKALRMQNPVDEEMAVVRLHNQLTPNTRGSLLEYPRKSNGVDLNNKSMQNIGIMSGNRLHQQQHLSYKPGDPSLKLSSSSHVAMSRTPKSPKDIDQGQSKSNSLQYIDADDIQSDHQNDLSDNDGEEVESGLEPEQAQSIGALDEAKSSTTDIPLDGKGWWIRQIEGKRRGEICPCTLNWEGSNEAESCWCGKERRVRYSQDHSARASTDWRAKAGKDRSTSKSPVRSA